MSNLQEAFLHPIVVVYWLSVAGNEDHHYSARFWVTLRTIHPILPRSICPVKQLLPWPDQRKLADLRSTMRVLGCLASEPGGILWSVLLWFVPLLSVAGKKITTPSRDLWLENGSCTQHTAFHRGPSARLVFSSSLGVASISSLVSFCRAAHLQKPPHVSS